MIKKDTLVLIPAKGKSTRLPGKNIMYLAGKSLLEWAIKSARDSALDADIMVSSEDKETLELAASLGAWIPYKRDEKLAVDPYGVEAVALDALSQLHELGYEYKTLVILLPTCPLRTGEDIRQAMKMFTEENSKRLFSVSEITHSLHNAWYIDNDFATPVFNDKFDKRTQELQSMYRCNGAVHILDVNEFKNTKSYIAQPLTAYVMPANRSIDIDTHEDFLFANWIMENNLDTRKAS